MAAVKERSYAFTFYIYCLRCSNQEWAPFCGKYSLLGLCHCLWYFRVFLTVVVILGTYMVSTMHIRRTKLKCPLAVAVMPSLLSIWYLGFYLPKPWYSWSPPSREVSQIPNDFHAEVLLPLCANHPQWCHSAGRFGMLVCLVNSQDQTHICESGHSWNQARYSFSIEGPC